MKRKYSSRYLPQHPIANRNGKVAEHRLQLWIELAGRDAPCHWCGTMLYWGSTLTCDHVDSDTHNNDPENLVPACRGCNANRADGTGHGRRDLSPKFCAWCGVLFEARPENHLRQRYCSRTCASQARPPKTKFQHGTEGRYKYGCKCDECRRAHRDYRYQQRHGTLEGQRRGAYNKPS